jgi:hypothetical protein
VAAKKKLSSKQKKLKNAKECAWVFLNNLLVLVFWVVTPCGLVGRYQCFRGNILPPSLGLK